MDGHGHARWSLPVVATHALGCHGQRGRARGARSEFDGLVGSWHEVGIKLGPPYPQCSYQSSSVVWSLGRLGLIAGALGSGGISRGSVLGRSSVGILVDVNSRARHVPVLSRLDWRVLDWRSCLPATPPTKKFARRLVTGRRAAPALYPEGRGSRSWAWSVLYLEGRGSRSRTVGLSGSRQAPVRQAQSAGWQTSGT